MEYLFILKKLRKKYYKKALLMFGYKMSFLRESSLAHNGINLKADRLYKRFSDGGLILGCVSTSVFRVGNEI
jgi:hypothetical protein